MMPMSVRGRVRIKLAIRGAMLSCLLVILGTSASAGAYEAVHLKLIAKTAGPGLFSDGARWAAYEPSAGTTRIIDARTGRAVSRPNPAGCSERGQPTVIGQRVFGLRAAGSGELLYACEGPPARGEIALRYVVEDAMSGAQHPVVVRGLRLGYEGEGATPLRAVGTQWVEGYAGYHSEGAFFINWHTGQVQWAPSRYLASKADIERIEVEVRKYDDLDSPTLLHALCSGVSRNPTTNASSPFHPFAFVPPLGISDTPFALQHCGTRRSELLPAGTAGVTSIQMGGGVLSWIASRVHGRQQMYATRLNDRANRWHGPVRLLLGLPGLSTLQHTATTVYQSVRRTVGSQVAIYAARLP
jgi:hypothetical protein